MHCFPVRYVFCKGIYLHLFPVEFRSMIWSSCAAVQGETGAFGIKLGSHLPGHYKNCGLHRVPRAKMPRRVAIWLCRLASIKRVRANWSTAPHLAVGSHPAGTRRLAGWPDRNFPSLTCVMESWLECTASCHPLSGPCRENKAELWLTGSAPCLTLLITKSMLSWTTLGLDGVFQVFYPLDWNW